MSRQRAPVRRATFPAEVLSRVAVLLLISSTTAGAGTMSGHFASSRWQVGTRTRVSSILAATVEALRRGPSSSLISPLVRTDGRGRVQVRVDLSRTDTATLRTLSHNGLDIELARPAASAVRGWIEAASVETLASVAGVRQVTAPDYPFPRAGSITGQHDTILNCDAVRTRFGIDGSRVRVGVISDGIDHIDTSRASGDAPAVTVPTDPLCHRGSGDEGSAMVELIHDCAPGAEIAFCGPRDDLEMVDCVQCLRNVFAADVIVDDLGFFRQPYFADGPVAQEVGAAVDAGVTYVSAAGNDGERHYQGRYHRCPLGDRHQFGENDCTLDFRFFGQLVIFLQWNEPFGAAGSDYDLCVPGLGCSQDVQDGKGDPFEAVAISCGGGICTGGMEIYKRSGDDAQLEVFFLPVGGAVDLLEHRAPLDSIVGHPCVPGVLAVSAIDAAEPGNARVEPFSSRGPCTLYFPAFKRRDKPDIAGIDGILNTGPGGFPSPFFGTSAAAPGVAAVAALLLDLDPSLTPAELRSTLMSTAIDLGRDGNDFTYGAGRADAIAAAESALPAGFSTRTPTPTTTATATETPPATATATPTARPTEGPCIGDCNGNAGISVDELVKGVAIVLDSASLPQCPAFDVNQDGHVTIDELVSAVNGALNGCIP